MGINFNMTKTSKYYKTWKAAILFVAICFQIIFIAELFFLYDYIVVDLNVHRITYENWVWLLDEWNAPITDYWKRLTPILDVVILLNRVFQFLFGIFIIYIFRYRNQFSLKGRTIVLTVVALSCAHFALSYYIMFRVDFYRVYMYAIYPEMLALYMIYCGRRLRISQ